MKRRISIPALALAGVSLTVFCWLGFAATRFGTIFAGLEIDLPVATQLVFAYGPIAFPLVGFGAGVLVILSDILFRRQWILWGFSGAFIVVVFSALKAMLISGVFVGPAHKAHRPDASNRAIVPRFQLVQHWAGESEQ